MYDKHIFGKHLRDLRELRWKQYKNNEDKHINPYNRFSCCKSQYAIAEELNIERRTYGKWENGTSIPTIDKVVDLCNLLDCNIDYLLGAEKLIGLSPSIIASHYSMIDIDIINRTIEDADYREFLNYFMRPDNCYSLVNSTTLTAWKKFNIDKEKESEHILEPLKSLITDIFHRYQAFTPSIQYNKETLREHIITCLPEEKVTFAPQKLNNKICISSCLSASKIIELNLNDNNPQNYQLLINYLTDYCFHIIFEKEYSNIQKEKLGTLFVHMLEKYLDE